MKKIILASNNNGKIREIQKLLTGFEVIPQAQAGFLDEVIEDGETFAENAYKKAQAVALFTNELTIADDSGICIDFLDGAPGIYSARYSGLGDDENNKKVLKTLENQQNRAAHFTCTLCLCHPNGEHNFFQGDWHGEIATEIKGENGFGYDSIFIPNGYNCTSAELTPEEKNSISHRHIALEKLAKYLT